MTMAAGNLERRHGRRSRRSGTLFDELKKALLKRKLSGVGPNWIVPNRATPVPIY
jgi:hypothetical protein